MSNQEAWERALQDAEVAADLVDRIELPRFASDRIAQHLPPGTTAGPGGPFAYRNDEVESLNQDADRHRIVHTAGIDEVALPGLLRSQLEHVRQYESQRGSYVLTNAINGSTTEEYGNRPGGAIVYLAMPMMRDAQAAGARLIRALYGPQFGRFGESSFGLLFRTDREPGTLDTLPQRTVVFGALHAEAFENWIGGEESANAHLEDAHPDAPEWWSTLKADELFGHLRKSAPAFTPAAEDIQKFGERAGEAWRPLESLLDRALEHGLLVLNRD